MRRDQLQSHEDRRLGGEPQPCQILSSQMQLDGLPEVSGYVVEVGSLGDYGDLKALGHIAGLLSGTNYSFDRSLKHPCFLYGLYRI